jgi:hypothetical protein
MPVDSSELFWQYNLFAENIAYWFHGPPAAYLQESDKDFGRTAADRGSHTASIATQTCTNAGRGPEIERGMFRACYIVLFDRNTKFHKRRMAASELGRRRHQLHLFCHLRLVCSLWLASSLSRAPQNRVNLSVRVPSSALACQFSVLWMCCDMMCISWACEIVAAGVL